MRFSPNSIRHGNLKLRCLGDAAEHLQTGPALRHRRFVTGDSSCPMKQFESILCPHVTCAFSIHLKFSLAAPTAKSRR